MLITRPNHDVTTNYLYYWSQCIVDIGKTHKLTVIDVAGNRANKKEVEGIIEKIKPSFICFNGHGDERTIGGYDNEPLIQKGDNESLLSGAVVFARACRSAKELGPACVKKGTEAYIGYSDDFIFLTEEAKESRPLTDKVAKLFLEPSNYVAIAFMKGHSAGQANQRSKDYFKNNIKKLMTSDTPKEDRELIPYLLWDMDHQICVGNDKVVL